MQLFAPARQRFDIESLRMLENEQHPIRSDCEVMFDERVESRVHLRRHHQDS